MIAAFWSSNFNKCRNAKCGAAFTLTTHFRYTIRVDLLLMVVDSSTSCREWPHNCDEMELGLEFDSEVCPSQHLHARVCRHEHCHPCLYPVYMIQPVVQPVWQPAVSCKQTSSRLSMRFNNRFDNRLDVCLHDTASCQTGWMFVYTIYPVVKPDWQPVVSCIQTLTGCQMGLTTGLTTSFIV